MEGSELRDVEQSLGALSIAGATADSLSSSMFDIFTDDNTPGEDRFNNNRLTFPRFDQNQNRLSKSVSVPHLNKHALNTASTRRKKTTEAGSIEDHEMQLEMDQLHNKLANAEEEAKQLLSVNTALAQQNAQLNQQLSSLIKEGNRVKTELNTIIAASKKELAAKEQTISHLSRKLQDYFSNLEESSSAGEREKKEESTKVHDQFIQIEELRKTCQYLKQMVWQAQNEKTMIQNEAQRLITEAQAGKQIDNSPTEPPTNRQANKNVVELLQHQLELYVEDFKAEKAEKERLMTDNYQLKKEITTLNEEKAPLIQQLKAYEEDFKQERDKRLQLLRKVAPVKPTPQQSQSTVGSSVSQQQQQQQQLTELTAAEQQRKWREYCCLVVEKDALTDRIGALESQGITRYNGRPGSTTSRTELPSYQTSSGVGVDNQLPSYQAVIAPGNSPRNRDPDHVSRYDSVSQIDYSPSYAGSEASFGRRSPAEFYDNTWSNNTDEIHNRLPPNSRTPRR